MFKHISALAALLMVLACTAVASGTEAAESRGGLHADAEVDPLAFALGGYSLHVGLGTRRVRFDLGAFAADVPEWVHGNDDFDVRFHGFGTKLDVFLTDDWRGAFVGLEAGLHDLFVRAPDGSVDTDRRAQLGARIGYRIPIIHDFYVTPWVGVGYAIGAEDRRVGGHAFQESPWIVFPTVHVAYRLR